VPQLADRRCGHCLTRQPISQMHQTADSWTCNDHVACLARGQAAGLFPQREDAAESAVEQALAAHEIQQGVPA
jgi:hypothetical protein